MAYVIIARRGEEEARYWSIDEFTSVYILASIYKNRKTAQAAARRIKAKGQYNDYALTLLEIDL